MLIDSVPAKIKVERWDNGDYYITRQHGGVSSHYVKDDKHLGYQAIGVCNWLFGYLKPGETREFTLHRTLEEKVTNEKPHPEGQADGASES